MPEINFSFQGWVNGARIDSVTVTASGTVLDVRDRTAEEVQAKLASGEWMVALGDYLYDSHRDSEIEIFDFDLPID